ncbi:LacI family DNA-binding transcriptional regulator [Frigidibacter sp. MR17.24]|uniref:LacI family DNA-binding transcriptional regulator n=1 Tax=Frigidibacter sp. MR17.24 TaxID=3127345 RepID=UPI003012FCD2
MQDKGFVTLEDVAGATGLSRAQVSRALRGDPGVKESTRQIVREAADRLGYVPNLAARHLASAQGTNVGILIGEPLNPFQIRMAHALDAALARVGLEATLSLRAQTDEDAVSEAERLRGLRIAGLIMVATPRRPAAIAQIAQRQPCVYVGEHVEIARLSTIGARNADGARQAVEHLIARGHRRIAHITGGIAPGSAERQRGYLAAMAVAGLAPIEVEGDHDFACGRGAVDALLALTPRPTAIFADNDFSAFGAINRLAECGLRIPEDMSIVGFDDVPFASGSHLALTTIRQSCQPQADAAVLALRARMANPSAPYSSRLLPVELVERRSVAAPRPD